MTPEVRNHCSEPRLLKPSSPRPPSSTREATANSERDIQRGQGQAGAMSASFASLSSEEERLLWGSRFRDLNLQMVSSVALGPRWAAHQGAGPGAGELLGTWQGRDAEREGVQRGHRTSAPFQTVPGPHLLQSPPPVFSTPGLSHEDGLTQSQLTVQTLTSEHACISGSSWVHLTFDPSSTHNRRMAVTVCQVTCGQRKEAGKCGYFYLWKRMRFVINKATRITETRGQGKLGFQSGTEEDVLRIRGTWK